MSTIRDVAKKAGVSVATVSNAFTANRCVNANTRRKVLEVARELSYTPSIIASSMVTKRTNIFGVFLYDYVYKNFLPYSEFLSGVVKECQNAGQRVLLYTDVKKSDLKSFASGREPIDGGIIFFPQQDRYRAEELRQSGLPMVFVGRSEASDVNAVDAQNDEIAFELTEKLLAAGHRKIAFFNSREEWLLSRDREDGFARALKKYGADIGECFINRSAGEEADLTQLKKALISGYRAFVFENPNLAEALYKEAEDRGWSVGKEVSAVFLGFDFRFEMIKPKLTSAKLRYDELGRKAAEILSRNMAGETESEQFLLKADVVEGNSIAKIS